MPVMDAGKVLVNCNVNTELELAKVPAKVASSMTDWKLTNCCIVRSYVPGVDPNVHCTIKPAS